MIKIKRLTFALIFLLILISGCQQDITGSAVMPVEEADESTETQPLIESVSEQSSQIESQQEIIEPQQIPSEELTEEQIQEIISKEEQEIKTVTIIAEVCGYKVSKVIDGDTFYLTNGQKVRLIGIDTPESYEDYFYEAKRKLEDLIDDKCIELETDVSETDRYGRLLRYVYVDDLFVNLELVEEGYAESYRYEPDIRYVDLFERAEQKAKEQGLGIWSSKDEKEPEQTTTHGYICNYNAYNCGDFSTHAQAQAVFEACGGVSNDVHYLDGDKDGLACESLP